MPSSSVAGAAQAMSGTPAIPSAQARAIENDRQQQSRKHAAFLHDDGLAADEDDVFSNPDTAELETRSDATGATSPAPNSPGPGSPMNRAVGHHIAVVASSPIDPYATLKQSGDVHPLPTSQSGKALALGSLPQMNVAALQQQFDQQAYLDATPRPVPATSSNQAPSIVTPTRASPRPNFGRAISASGATMQTMGSSMLATHSSNGAGRTGPPTPRLGGHSSSQSASSFSIPHAQLPSAHGLPSDPQEASTLSKLFAHPPAQSPAEELQAFSFTGDHMSRRGNMLAGSPVHERHQSSSLASMRLSRPTTRPPSPDRYVQPSRKLTTQRASVGAAMGLGLPSRMTDDAVAIAAPERESSIFERDIEHRDASHILSKQEAIDVAIPSVLDDAVEAITQDSAEQVEIITPHAASPPLALSTQALSAHSNSQIKLQQPAGGVPASSILDSGASSPRHAPGSPLSSTGGVASTEPPPGSMAAQIAERFASTSTKTPLDTEPAAPGTPARHRRPISDVSNMSSSTSSLRSRSPQAPLTAGVQQVLAATNMPNRSTTSGATQVMRNETNPASTNVSTAAASATASPTSTTVRTTLPTATALPALPLPNPYRSYSPTTAHSPLPETSSSVLPSVSMDGAVMPANESATMDASLGSLADVMASQPSTSVRSLSNSPLMRMRGLGLEDQSLEPSPYSARSPVPAIGSTTDGVQASQPTSPVIGKHFASNAHADEYVAPSTVGKKRLSFFSYADIINQTPAEVLNFDEALRQAEIASPSKTNMSGLLLPGSPQQCDKRH